MGQFMFEIVSIAKTKGIFIYLRYHQNKYAKFVELPSINNAFFWFSRMMSKSIKNIYKMTMREHLQILKSFTCNYIYLVELCTRFAST